METIRDFTQSAGLTAETFNYLIFAVIVVGGVWALIRLYQDLTSPPMDEWNETKD